MRAEGARIARDEAFPTREVDFMRVLEDLLIRLEVGLIFLTEVAFPLEVVLIPRVDTELIVPDFLPILRDPEPADFLPLNSDWVTVSL